jgi:hypothetical protein
MLLDRAARVAVRAQQQRRAVGNFRTLIEHYRLDGPTCAHEGLARINVPGKCDDCGDELDKYLYRGRACGVEICLQCFTTRLWLLRLDDMLDGAQKTRARAMAKWWLDERALRRVQAGWNGADNQPKPQSLEALRYQQILPRRRQQGVTRCRTNRIVRREILRRNGLNADFLG